MKVSKIMIMIVGWGEGAKDSDYVVGWGEGVKDYDQ